MDTPVVFMVFNRPAVAKSVLQAIRAARPRRLTVVCDGPRPCHPTDADRVAEMRGLVESAVDWPCELTRDYADSNLGCGPRVASGLTAAFQRYDRAIVLEDDTAPEPSFFPFCEAMLDRYANDPDVMHVSGTNAVVAKGLLPSSDAYRLNRLPDIWGWASWRRAWQKYDFGVEDWRATRETDWLEGLAPNLAERRILHGAFNVQLERGANRATWDWSWIYACVRHGRSVTPMRNLVANIGFGIDSTNCLDTDDPLGYLPTEPIDTEGLVEPEADADGQLDALLLTHRFGGLKARRKASFFGRLRSDRLIRKARRWLYGPTGRPHHLRRSPVTAPDDAPR